MTDLSFDWEGFRAIHVPDEYAWYVMHKASQFVVGVRHSMEEAKELIEQRLKDF